MRFKLDENLDRRLATLLEEAGHEADGVSDEGLSGEPDTHIFEVCQTENRVLVTLDLDFSNTLQRRIEIPSDLWHDRLDGNK